MSHEIYKGVKSNLIEFAKELGFDDLPARRENLNNYLDSEMNDMEYQYVLKDKISQKQCDLYRSWLESLLCTLHDKNIK